MRPAAHKKASASRRNIRCLCPRRTDSRRRSPRPRSASKSQSSTPADVQELKRRLVLFAGLADETMTRVGKFARKTEKRSSASMYRHLIYGPIFRAATREESDKMV